jgi:hypothetical protein
MVITVRKCTITTGTTDSSTEDLFPQDKQQNAAKLYIMAISEVCAFLPAKTPAEPRTWTSDRSIIPATSGLRDNKLVTSAAMGPRALILQLSGRNASILQGESMGLTSALTLADPLIKPNLLCSDHLNSMRLIEDSHSHIDQEYEQ